MKIKNELIKNIYKTKDIIPSSLYSMDQLSYKAVNHLFDLSEFLSRASYEETHTLLKGKTLASLFYQPSTRTRLNFHAAANNLGLSVIGFSDPLTTRAGDFYNESLYDVITCTAPLCDIFVLRHFENNAAKMSAEISAVPLINAGDGSYEHPTQALGDIWTMFKEMKQLEGKKIGLVGDLNLRSLRSLIKGLSLFPIAQFLFLLPEAKKIPEDLSLFLEQKNILWEQVEDIKELFSRAHIIETLGIHHADYNLCRDNKKQPDLTDDKYVITAEKNKLYNKNNISILNPGPRTTEVTRDVDILPQAAYFRQIKNGLYMRMALLACLTLPQK